MFETIIRFHPTNPRYIHFKKYDNKLPTPQVDGVLIVPHLHIKWDSSQATGEFTQRD